MTTDYPRIPDPPSPSPDATAAQYGAVLFAHVITHGAAGLTLAQLELAAYAGVRASTTAGLLPCVYQTLSDARHVLASAIAARAVPVPVEMAGGTSPHRPEIGPMAPVSIGPVTRPPSPSYAEPRRDYAPGPSMRPTRDAIPF